MLQQLPWQELVLAFSLHSSPATLQAVVLVIYCCWNHPARADHKRLSPWFSTFSSYAVQEFPPEVHQYLKVQLPSPSAAGCRDSGPQIRHRSTLARALCVMKGPCTSGRQDPGRWLQTSDQCKEQGNATDSAANYLL